MAFMKPEIVLTSMWHVKTTHGSELVPWDLVPVEPTQEDFSDYIEGRVINESAFELQSGWYARLSAPGYMDCTDWGGPFETEQEALEYLTETYLEDDE